MHASKRYVANVRRPDMHAPFTAGRYLPYVVSCDGRYYALFGARSACKMNPRSLKHLPFSMGMLAIEAPGQCLNTYSHVVDRWTFLRRKEGGQHSMVALFILTTFPPRFDSAWYLDYVLF